MHLSIITTTPCIKTQIIQKQTLHIHTKTEYIEKFLNSFVIDSLESINPQNARNNALINNNNTQTKTSKIIKINKDNEYKYSEQHHKTLINRTNTTHKKKQIPKTNTAHTY